MLGEVNFNVVTSSYPQEILIISLSSGLQEKIRNAYGYV